MLGRGAKYFFVPLGITIFTPATVYAKEENESIKLVKRAPWDVYCEPPKKTDELSSDKKPAATGLEKCIQKCREDVGPFQSQAADYFSQAKAFLQNTCSAVSENVKYLQTGASDDVRYATIAGTGLLSGIIFGFRKRFFKKLFYVALGSGTTAAIIYPKEAKIMAKEGSVYAKDGFKSAYASILGDQEKEACDNKKKKKEKKDSTKSS